LGLPGVNSFKVFFTLQEKKRMRYFADILKTPGGKTKNKTEWTMTMASIPE
jgi:hypothetical protein